MRAECVLVALALFVAAPAWALDPALRCQRELEHGGHRIARTALRSFERCAVDAIAPATCLAGPVARARLDRVLRRWHERSARACRGIAVHTELGYLDQCAPSGTACAFAAGALDAPGPRNDLVDCLACRVEDGLANLSGKLFAEPDSDHVCQRTLVRSGLAVARGFLDEIKSCLADRDALSIAACLNDPERRARLAAEESAWRADATSSCAGQDPFSAFGYPPLCSEITPTGIPLCSDTAPPCTFAATTALSRPGGENDLLDCLACQTTEAVLAVARALHGAEVCCTAAGCGTIRSRAACRSAGGQPRHYRIDEVPIPPQPETPGGTPGGGITNAHGIAVARDGTIYLPSNEGIRALRPDGTRRLFPGPRAYGIAIDDDGMVFGAARDGVAVHVADGGTSLLAGHPAPDQPPGHDGDGGFAVAARINAPNGIAVDTRGNVYVTESGALGAFFEGGGAQWTGEHVRMIDPAGIIHTVAGVGGFGVSGMGGPATSAGLAVPYSLAVRARGTLLIGEVGAQRVLEIESGGHLVLLAGRVMSPIGFFAGDGGPAHDAAFYSIEGLAEDPDGKVAVADFRNGRIRLLDGLGSVITIAGTGAAVVAGAANGDGGPGAFAAAGCPAGLAADATGRFFYPDLQLDRLRVLTPVPY